jgi:hypothetical protein
MYTPEEISGDSLKTKLSRCGRQTFVLLMLAVAAFSLPVLGQNLKVTLLGTGYPDPRMDRFGPSILVEAGKEKLLFDCGRGAAQRLANGEWLVPLSATQSTIVLETTNPGGMRYRYEGILSGDGKNISGQWLGGNGGTLNAPTLYKQME